MYANQRLCDMLGYRADEIIGRPAIEFLDEEGRKVWAREFKKRKKGDSTPYQMTLRTKNGEAVPVIVSPKPIFDEKGVFKGSYSAITDIRDLWNISVANTWALGALAQYFPSSTQPA